MFLKTRVISRFSTTRIDYKNWLKTSQILSNTAPVIQYQDNPELQAYKKKIREEYRLEEYFKCDNKEFIHGIEPPRKVEQVYHFIDLYDYVNIIPYEPDTKWLFEDFLLRYCEVPIKMAKLSPTKVEDSEELEDYKEEDFAKLTEKPDILATKLGELKEGTNTLSNETFYKALDVIYDRFKKRKSGGSFNIEAEINELAHMTDEDFKRKYPKHS